MQPDTRSGVLLRWTALVACLLIGIPALAGTIFTNGTFQTTNQSIWTSGTAFNWSYNTYKGTGFNVSPSIGFGGKFLGGWAGFHLSGSIGVQVGANVTGGSVDASVPFSSSIDLPNVISPGSTFTPSASIGLGPSTFSTTGPTAGAYADLKGSIYADAWAKGCIFWSCGTTTGVIINKSFTKELAAINRNNDGQVRILGYDVPVSGSFGPVSYSMDPSMNGATGSGIGTVMATASTDVAQVGVDIASIFADYIGIPVSGSIKGVINWSLISASVTLDTYFKQSFAFTPTVTLDLHVEETGQDAWCVIGGGCDAIIVPDDVSKLTITPEYFATGVFDNDTDLVFAPGYDVSLLSASFNLGKIHLGSLGPAWQWNDQFPLPGISVYDNAFDLGGFQEIDGQPFTIIVTTPEPTSLILLGTGILIIGSLVRRRH